MIEISANSVTVGGAGQRPIVLLGAWHHEVKILKTPEELAEWERRVEGILGQKVSAQAMLQGGGCCCGSGGGMCDTD